MAWLSPLSSERRFVNLLLMSYLILILRSLVNMLPDGDSEHPHDQWIYNYLIKISFYVSKIYFPIDSRGALV